MPLSSTRKGWFRSFLYADLVGMSLAQLSDCKYLESLNEGQLYELIITNKLKIKIETLMQTYDRVFVFLYLKLKKSPLLTDENIENAYRKPNDSIFPLKLEKTQFNELRNIIVEAYNKNKNHVSLSINIFNTNINDLNKQIELWEKRNMLIYHGTQCTIGNKAGGDLNRTIAFILKNDTERQNAINRDVYGCSIINNISCINVTYTKHIILLNDDQYNSRGIILNNIKNVFTVNLKDIFKVRVINEALSKGYMTAINPRLGFILQTTYPEIWSKSYWLPNVDTIDRITILTLQATAFFRSEDESNRLYIRPDRKELLALESKKLNELIENQVWALSKDEMDYATRIKNKNYKGVRYKSLADLNKLPSFIHYKLIFLRHAQSCGNIWKTQSKMRQITYQDPEITEAGVQTSIRLARVLQKKISELWKNEPYSVCSSQMIRAQETAYYMTKKPINVIPHVAEDGITLDNFAFAKEKQRAIIGGRNPKILENLDKGIDSRKPQTIFDKSSWTAFLKWADTNPQSFSIGSDGIYRAIIFTHSHFIAKSLGLKIKVKNNNGYLVTVENGAITNSNRLDIGETLGNDPDKCRISPYKQTKKIILPKRKRSSRHTRKACKEFMNNDDLLMDYNQGTYKTHLLNLISYSQKST